MFLGHYASNFLYNAPYFLPQHDKYSYSKVASGCGIATNSINWLTFCKKKLFLDKVIGFYFFGFPK